MSLSNIYLYQVVVMAISAIMIYQGFSNFVKGRARQTILKLLIRIFVWGGITIVALFPSVTNIFADIIGLKGNINAVILTGFLLVFLMIFKLLSAIEKLEQDMSKLTRKDSLKEIKKTNNE